MLKGKLIVGQSGGPTAVINASLAGVIQAAQQRMEITGIYGLVHGIEGALREELIDLGAESAGAVERLKITPASILGSCRHKLAEGEYERILEVFRAHDVRHFVYIGGNDSMDTCQVISELAERTGYELQVAGVPKTVDNDLALTDHTPGYPSAARFVALAARDTGRDLEAMATFEDVSILETMGRNAGWLAAAAALGKQDDDEAPHLVYVPEIPFDEERFLADVAEIHGRLGRVFVAVSEGLRYADGEFVGAHTMQAATDAFGHVLATLTKGVAAYLADLVSERLKLRARFLRPVLVGRAFTDSVSPVDRREAYAVGRAAVEYLAAGGSGSMITLERLSNDPYESGAGLAPLSEAANTEKLLPRSYMNAAGNLPAPEFHRYALPLIGPLEPLARLRGERVPKKT